MSRNSIRFTFSERARRQQARHVLDDPASTPQQKTIARQNIEEVFKSAQARLDARKAKRAIGPPPDPAGENYETELKLYRARLDELAAGKVLDNPSASFAQRERVRRKLEARPNITPRERRFPWEAGERERAAHFLDELQREVANAPRMAQ